MISTASGIKKSSTIIAVGLSITGLENEFPEWEKSGGALVQVSLHKARHRIVALTLFELSPAAALKSLLPVSFNQVIDYPPTIVVPSSLILVAMFPPNV